MKLNNKKVVVFDLETNGSSFLPITHELHHIIQIAAKTIEGKIIINEYVNTNRHIPDISQNCHGLTNEFIQQNGKHIKNVIHEFIQQLNSYRNNQTLYLVAHNATGFDKIVLEETFKKNNIQLPSWIVYVDTLIIFRNMYKNLNIYSKLGRSCFQLGSLHNYFIGENIKDAHNAINDVEGLRKLLLHIINYDIDINKEIIDESKNIKEFRFIGKWRQNKIKMKTGHTDLRQIRRYFNESSIYEIELFIRKEMKVNKDQQVLEIIKLVAPQYNIHLNDLNGEKDGKLISILKQSISELQNTELHQQQNEIWKDIDNKFKSDNELILFFLYKSNGRLDYMQTQLGFKFDELFVNKIIQQVYQYNKPKIEHK